MNPGYPPRQQSDNISPYFKIYSESLNSDPESALLNDFSYYSSSVQLHNKPYGLFNNKHPLHIIPQSTKRNLFMNRISYDTQSDSYYENGIIDKKYIEFWDQGVLCYENLNYAIKYSRNRTNSEDTVALIPVDDGPSSIIYKFDYSQYGCLEISSLTLKLNRFNEKIDCNWIISISTNLSDTLSNATSVSLPSNRYSDLKNRKWEKIEITDPNENITQYVKNKKFFYIKAEVFGDRERNIQLFPQIKRCFDTFENNIEGNFGLDVIVELSPLTSYNLSKSLSLNDELDFNLKASIEEEESSRLNKNTLIFGGLFNDKYRFNVLPIEKKKDTYNHRISYNVITNAYYENGKTDVKYLKKWDRGAFMHHNVYYYPETASDIKITRTLSHDNRNLPAYMAWKFDYRLGNLYISSLTLKVKFFDSSDNKKVQWSIQLLPTRRNPDPEFKPIIFSLQDEELNDLCNNYITLDLTEMVKDEYGFILNAHVDGITTHEDDEKTQLFRQYLDDSKFCMDIKVELQPNMVCDLIFEDNKKTSENEFNEESTSDFVIRTKDNSCKGCTEKIFHLHAEILSAKSDYFKALMDSNMVESQKRCLVITDISYFILEKLLLFIYTDNVEDMNEIEHWISLLYAASRFLMTELVQICELSIRKFVNFDNVEKIEIVAENCNALQLLKFCKMFEINKGNVNKKEIPKYKIIVKNIKNIVKRFVPKRKK